MKTFKRTNLPDQIKYNNEIYKRAVLGSKFHPFNFNTQIEMLKIEGFKVVIIEVLQTCLKGVNSFFGTPYKPTKWIYTNYKPSEK